MTMNLPHLHLLLNHVPTVGTAIAVALLVLTLVRRHDALRRVSLELFCVIALLTIPAYLSGVGTQVRLREQMPDISTALMQRHHDAAVLSFALMLLTGGFAWMGLWQFRRVSRQSTFNTAAVMLLSLATVVLMARAATMGGDIRHPEIGALEPAASVEEDPSLGFDPTVEGEPGPDGADAADPALGDAGVEPGADPGTDPDVIPDEGGGLDAGVPDPASAGILTATFINAYVNERVWLWPAMETLHFIGLWLLFGVVLIVHLRMLGVMPQTSFASLHRLLPWSVLGLGINVITGMMFVIANPADYMGWPFYWKIGLLMLAGVNLIYFTVFDGPWSVTAGRRAPFRVQAMAAASIALWAGVMYFGRMLPFLGEAF